MKKLFIFIALVVCSTAAASTIEYSDRLSERQMNSATRTDAEWENSLKDYGAPSVPFMSYRFLLPFGEKVDEVGVELDDFRLLARDIRLDCAQPRRIFGRDPITIEPDETIYKSDRFYPYADYSFKGVGYLSGYAVATVHVYPCKYNPVAEVLGCYGSFKLTIKTSKDNSLEARQSEMICGSEAISARIERLVVNISEINSYPAANVPVSRYDLIDPGDPASMIIVAGDAYVDLFNDYALWKAGHGVVTAVYTIEDILSEYTSGVDGPDNLRDFITAAYQAWAATETPLEYVLLAGDDEIIPVRGVWGDIGVYVPITISPAIFITVLWTATGTPTVMRTTARSTMSPICTVRFVSGVFREIISRTSRI